MADAGTIPEGLLSTEEVEMKKVIKTTNCELSVYVQGDIAQAKSKPVILTVHDMGSNHNSWKSFFTHGSMMEVKLRSILVHVDVPGQEDNAADLPQGYAYPKLQQIGEALGEVLEQLNIQYAVGIGEGAGANILARFGMAHPKKCLGLCLIHCTSTRAGVMEYFKDKIMNWKLEYGMNPTAEEYLVFHKFGSERGQGEAKMAPMDIMFESKIETAATKEQREQLIRQYTTTLAQKINPHNLRLFVDCFRARSEIASKLQTDLTCDTLLVTGAKASHLHTVYTMHQNLAKSKSSLLKIDDVGDVITEAPDKLATSFILFIKGIGLLTTVRLPGQSTSRQGSFSGRGRAMSMEEADRPVARRFSGAGLGASPPTPQSPLSME